MLRTPKKAIATVAITLTTAGLLTAAGLMAPSAAMATSVDQPAPKPLTAVTTPAASPGTVGPAISLPPTRVAGYLYHQRGNTVSIYKRGKKVATVTPTSATTDGRRGTLTLRVWAKRSFSFTAGQFIWEYPDGADNRPIRPNRKLHFERGSTRTVTLAYRNVGPGTVIWAPTAETVVGIWTVPAR